MYNTSRSDITRSLHTESWNQVFDVTIIIVYVRIS